MFPQQMAGWLSTVVVLAEEQLRAEVLPVVVACMGQPAVALAVGLRSAMLNTLGARAVLRLVILRGLVLRVVLWGVVQERAGLREMDIQFRAEEAAVVAATVPPQAAQAATAAHRAAAEVVVAAVPPQAAQAAQADAARSACGFGSSLCQSRSPSPNGRYRAATTVNSQTGGPAHSLPTTSTPAPRSAGLSAGLHCRKQSARLGRKHRSVRPGASRQFPFSISLCMARTQARVVAIPNASPNC